MTDRAREPGSDPTEQTHWQSDGLRTIWSRWMLMMSVCLVTVLGLGITLFLFLGGPETNSFWPAWYTQSILLFGLVTALVVMTAHQSGKLRGLLKYQGHSLLERETFVSNRLMALRKLTRFVGSNVDLQKILDHITETGLETFSCEQVSIMLLDAEADELEVLSAAGLINKKILGSRQKVGFGVAGKVAKTAQPIILGSEVDSRHFVDFKKQGNTSASMVVPIMLRDELIGVLCISSRQASQVYNSNDLQILQVFAEIVAVCIRHTQQATWMRNTIDRLSWELGNRRPHLPGSRDAA